MTHFPDGSPYTFLTGENPDDAQAVNVGWLDASEPHLRGPVPAGLVGRLAELCRASVNRTRGHHQCNLCEPAERPPFPSPTRSSPATGNLLLGSAEIRATGSDGTLYAAPDLILHYVEAHQYRPPDSFSDAVILGRNPD